MLKQLQGSLKATKIEQEDKTLKASAQLKVDVANVGLVLVEAVRKVREAAARTQSSNNLKQIALAMHNYHGTYNRLPPQATYDKNGKPMLSWRVMILPFIEQQNLYNRFHLDEPWDSEHNKKLLARMPKIYASPQDEKTLKEHTTHYQGFVGKGALFEGKQGTPFHGHPRRHLEHVHDRRGIEGGAVDQAGRHSLRSGQALAKLGLPGAAGFLASMCDGSVRICSRKIIGRKPCVWSSNE